MTRLDRFYLRILIAVTIGLVTLSVNRLLPPRLAGGSDLSIFRAAAWATLHRLNPYGHQVILRGMLATGAPRHSIGPDTLFVSPLWIALFFIWTVPLPLNLAYLVWSLASITLVGWGFYCLAGWAGWRARFGVVFLVLQRW